MAVLGAGAPKVARLRNEGSDFGPALSDAMPEVFTDDPKVRPIPDHVLARVTWLPSSAAGDWIAHPP